jgi:hypothetical protein
MATMRLVSLCALLAALAACGSPPPRGYAQPGVASSGDLATLNAPYYVGAEPGSRPKGSRGGP